MIFVMHLAYKSSKAFPPSMLLQAVMLCQRFVEKGKNASWQTCICIHKAEYTHKVLEKVSVID